MKISIDAYEKNSLYIQVFGQLAGQDHQWQFTVSEYDEWLERSGRLEWTRDYPNGDQESGIISLEDYYLDADLYADFATFLSGRLTEDIMKPQRFAPKFKAA